MTTIPRKDYEMGFSGPDDGGVMSIIAPTLIDGYSPVEIEIDLDDGLTTLSQGIDDDSVCITGRKVTTLGEVRMLVMCFGITIPGEQR